MKGAYPNAGFAGELEAQVLDTACIISAVLLGQSTIAMVPTVLSGHPDTLIFSEDRVNQLQK